MKIIQKLSFRLILFQLLALHLFGNAFFRFYYFVHADFYESVFKNGKEVLVNYLGLHPNQSVTNLVLAPFYYKFYGLLFGIIVVSIFNAIKKRSVLNTLLILILYILGMFVGAFSERYLDSWIHFLGKLFSKKIGISNLIASLIAFSMALLLVWLSAKNKLPSNKEKNA
jgi:hypothetical protein